MFLLFYLWTVEAVLTAAWMCLRGLCLLPFRGKFSEANTPRYIHGRMSTSFTGFKKKVCDSPRNTNTILTERQDSLRLVSVRHPATHNCGEVRLYPTPIATFIRTHTPHFGRTHEMSYLPPLFLLLSSPPCFL